MTTSAEYRPLIYFLRFAHHGKYSSYCRLADYLGPGCQDVRVLIRSSLLVRYPRLMRWWLRLNECRLLPYFLSRELKCIHYLYPENTLFSGGSWKRGHHLVLTWHQPISYFRALPHSVQIELGNLLRQATGVVFLSTQCENDYAEMLKINRSRVILHGVDTTFFQPGPPKQDHGAVRVVTVGNWLRDHDFWARTVNTLLREETAVEFQVLCSPETTERLRRVLVDPGNRVSFCHGLDDEQLRAFYQRASIAFHPLQDATANNALLESMACALPSVVTDLPATREYASAGAVFFDRQDVLGAVGSIRQLARSPALREALGLAGRLHAESALDWQLVADQHLDFYRALGGLKSEITGSS